MKKKKTLIIALIIIGIIFVTIGVTYAVLSYSNNGFVENVIGTEDMRFHYNEGNRSISLTDAMPMTDQQGQQLDKYFDFTITSKTSNNIKIPYYITVKRNNNDSSLDSAVKLYLTEINNGTEVGLTLHNNKQISKYSELASYINLNLNIDASKNEKILFISEVPKNNNNYSENYRLRMWISDDFNYAQTISGSCSDSTYIEEDPCRNNGGIWTNVATATEKTFTVTVNVYAEGESVTSSSDL